MITPGNASCRDAVCYGSESEKECSCFLELSIGHDYIEVVAEYCKLDLLKQYCEVLFNII